MRPIIIFSFILSLFSFPLKAQNSIPPLSETYMDSLVHASMKAFEVPGIAVGIIKDGRVVLAKGYGLRSLKSQKPMDENTLFGIASNSKAFTTTALGILVDQGKIRWDDKVREYIPEFKLYSPYVTEEFTIKDLITHRSGLGLGAGDLMFWPDSNNFKLAEIIYNLRYLKSVSSFRTKFDYDNLLYMVAGEIIHRVSGKPWDEFIGENILSPLGMSQTQTFGSLKDKSDIIDAHSKFDGKVQVIARNTGTNMNAAGGLYSSINDLSKWVIMHLNDGIYGNGKVLISRKNHEELWSPQTIIPVYNKGPYNMHFSAYGLGFFIDDAMGYKELSHTGGLEGMVTEITMIPELKLGIIVLTNQESGAAFRSITNQIKDHYLGISGTHRVQDFAKRLQERTDIFQKEKDRVWAHSDSIRKLDPEENHLKTYLGYYKDAWLGGVHILFDKGSYRVIFDRSMKLTGTLFPYSGNACLVKWDRHQLDADAYMIFNLDENGKAVSISMHPISEETDFSYDFQDLDLKSTNK